MMGIIDGLDWSLLNATEFAAAIAGWGVRFRLTLRAGRRWASDHSLEFELGLNVEDEGEVCCKEQPGLEVSLTEYSDQAGTETHEVRVTLRTPLRSGCIRFPLPSLVCTWCKNQTRGGGPRLAEPTPIPSGVNLLAHSESLKRTLDV